MEYDDIIVGAGSSGAVLAARLSEDPKRSVLLLAAGPDYRTIEETPRDLLRSMASLTDHDWGWQAQATREREIAYTRGKVTGGCSAVNGSVAIRGIPADFDEWERSETANGALKRSCPSIANWSTTQILAVTCTAKVGRSGSNVPSYQHAIRW